MHKFVLSFIILILSSNIFAVECDTKRVHTLSDYIDAFQEEAKLYSLKYFKISRKIKKESTNPNYDPSYLCHLYEKAHPVMIAVVEKKKMISAATSRAYYVCMIKETSAAQDSAGKMERRAHSELRALNKFLSKNCGYSHEELQVSSMHEIYIKGGYDKISAFSDYVPLSAL